MIQVEQKKFDINLNRRDLSCFKDQYKIYFEIIHTEFLNQNDVRLTIKALNFVGTISLPNRETLFIKPKIKKAKILYMFAYVNPKYAKILDPIINEVGFDDIFNFFEVLLNRFLDVSENIIIHQLRKKPILKEVCSQRIKGKILINKLSYSQDYLKGNFFCEIGEFSIDNLDNQIIKFILYHLYYSSINKKQRQRIQRLLMSLSRVSLKEISIYTFRRLRYNKLNQHYKSVHFYCQLFIEKFILGSFIGNKSTHSFLVNTAVLYEEFLREIFKRFLADFKIHKGFGKLDIDHELKVITLNHHKKPDILFLKKKRIYLIADAKYKFKYDWRNDAMQMGSYLRTCILLDKYKSPIKFPKNYRDTLLIYPKKYHFDNSNTDKHFIPYDIGDDILGRIWYIRIDLSKIDDEIYLITWINRIKAKFLKGCSTP